MEDNNIKSDIDEIKKTLAAIQKEDRSVKVAFDTLYQELDHYKSEFSLKLEKQLLQDLLTFYDSLLWFQQTISDQPENIDDNLKYLNEEFLELLRRRDVLPFPPSSHFNGQQHRVLQIIKTANLEDDEKIQKIIRRGFFRGEKIMRDEEVTIYRYDEDLNTSASIENTSEHSVSNEDVIPEQPNNAEAISIQLTPATKEHEESQSDVIDTSLVEEDTSEDVNKSEGSDQDLNPSKNDLEEVISVAEEPSNQEEIENKETENKEIENKEIET